MMSKIAAVNPVDRRPLLLLGVVLPLLLCACSSSPGTPTPGTSSTPAVKPLQIERTTDVPLSGGTTRFDYQTIDPKSGLLFIAHLGSSIVHVYDTKANKIVADIPNISGVHGVLAVPDLGKVYAAATGDNQVEVIDEATLKVTARTEGGDYPDGLAYDPNTRKVYVSDEHGSNDTVIDTITDKRIGSVEIGGEAGNTQFDPVSRHIFVAVQTLNQIVTIDTSTDKVIGHYDLPGCDHSHGLYVDYSQRRAFVACDGNAKLLVLEMESGKVVGEQSVGDNPDVLALDSGWQRLYVASESGVVSIFDVSGRGIRKIGEGQLDGSAHTVAVDQATHLVYLPLENVNGQPVLRIIRYSAP